MFCENCGTELPDFAKFCGKCGRKIVVLEKDDTTVLLDNFSTQTSVSNPTEIIDKSHVAIAGDSAAVSSTVSFVQDITPRGFSSKKHLIILALGVVLAIVIAIVGINVGVSHSHSQSVARGFEIAERYLSELNYEQAVIEFRNILEIEPMNVEAYLGLAESYVGIGKTNKAIKILKKGYDLTGDERIQDMIDELERGDESIVSSSSSSSETVEPVEEEPVIVEPIENYENLILSGDYGYTESIGTFDNPNGEADTYYVVKMVGDGVVRIKESEYPMFVSEDGYIIYYGSLTSSSAQIKIDNPQGKVICRKTILTNTDSRYIGWGIYVDRLFYSFVQGEYAFYLADDCTYVFSKDGSVKSSHGWPYIEGIGALSYLQWEKQNVCYFYLPDLDKVYDDSFMPDTLYAGDIKIEKDLPCNNNYGSVIVYRYLQDRTGQLYVPDEESYYVIMDLETKKYSDVFREVSANGSLFEVKDLNGQILYYTYDLEPYIWDPF